MAGVMHLSARKLCQRFDRAWRRHEGWDHTLRQIYQLALPQRNIYDGQIQGQERGQDAFDSTAITATQRAANRFVSEFFPPGGGWFTLEPGPFAKARLTDKELGQMKRALVPLRQQIGAVFLTGGFDTAAHEAGLELLTGRCTIQVDADEDPMSVARFTALPRPLVAVEEGAHNKIRNHYAKRRMGADLIDETWPEAKLTEKLRRLADQDKPADVDLKICLLYDVPTKTYRYVVLYEAEDHILVDRIYRGTSPMISARWMKVAGEHDGRGPLMYALPDIRTANAVVELVLRQASLAVMGVYLYQSDAMLFPEQFAIKPGALHPVKHTANQDGPTITEVPVARNFDVSGLVLGELRDQIKKALFDDRLPPDNGPVRSPTEISARMKELFTDVGASFGRLMEELVVPLVQRVVDIMAEKQLIDHTVIDQQWVKVTVTSPLARFQNADDLQATMQLVEMLMVLGGPEAVKAKVDEGALVAYVAELLGVPLTLVRDPEEAEEIEAGMAAVASGQADALSA